MGSTKKTGKGRFVPRAEIKNEDRQMRRREAKEEIAQNLKDMSRMRIPVKKGIEDIMKMEEEE